MPISFKRCVYIYIYLIIYKGAGTQSFSSPAATHQPTGPRPNLETLAKASTELSDTNVSLASVAVAW